MTKRRRPLEATEEEKRLMRAVLRDVIPLPGALPLPVAGPPLPAAAAVPAAALPASAGPGLGDARKAAAAAAPPRPPMVAPRPPVAVPPGLTLGPHLAPKPLPPLAPAPDAPRPGRSNRPTPGVDRRTDSRLRRGRRPIEGRIDLHGMTVARAREALTEFLTRCWAEERRSILVITGKGRLFDGETGKIKRALPHWLAEPPLDRLVLSHHDARIDDGGEGALYLLLRRRRSGRKGETG